MSDGFKSISDLYLILQTAHKRIAAMRHHI